tara:strand:+ start:167 stop:403 length:237 start_codon:yes stop_codon:yes gene_type:complete
MQEIFRILIGIVILLLAFPLGSWLAKETKEELKQGKKWFKLIIILSFVGAIVSLFFRSDVLFFSFLFIAIITSRSLRK